LHAIESSCCLKSKSEYIEKRYAAMYLKEIQDIVDVKIIRNGEFETLGMITNAEPNSLAYLDDGSYSVKLTKNENVSCVITKSELIESVREKAGLAIAKNPRKEFYGLHSFLTNETQFYWESFSTCVSPDAFVHPKAFVSPKNVRIGARTVIEAGAVVLERTLVGEDVIIRSGCTVGTPGLEVKRIDGQILSVAHAGGVRLRDRVELQANCVISCSVLGGTTEIGEDSKIGHLVNVGHDVRIGKRSLIVASAVIGGSAVISDDVWVGPGACIANGVMVGEGARVSMGAVVINHVDPGMRVSGNFAIAHRKLAAFIHSIR
jgi:UDP-3-O-[3-hydroxymyristoyl] glucosamine N-acyltransferase